MASNHSKISNPSEIQAATQLAALKATAALRALGLRLSPEAHDIPLASETQAHLYALVDEAIAAFLATKDAAPVNAFDIEGEAKDNLFEVYVVQRADFKHAVDVEILMRLA